jgi:twitching motility protein PilT
MFPPHQQSQVRAQLSFCLLAVFSQRLLSRKGAAGRVLATELMQNNSAIAHLIREGKTQNIYSVIETQGRMGMWTMDANLRDLYLEGHIEREEARRRMKNPQLLED